MRSRLVLILAIVLLLGSSMALFVTDLSADGASSFLASAAWPAKNADSSGASPTTKVEAAVALPASTAPPMPAAGSFRC